jgi:hypothetical protein
MKASAHGHADRRSLRFFFGLVSLFVLFLSCGRSPAHAMHIEYKEGPTVLLGPTDLFVSDDAWYATSYDIANIEEVRNYCSRHPDECVDENGKPPAMKLCFWKDPEKKMNLCHRIVDARPGFPYERTTSLKIERLCDRGCPIGSGLVLDARNEGFMTGWLGGLSCWIYDKKSRDFVNILPPVRFTEEGECKIIRGLGSGINGVIVEANPLSDWHKEGRFGPHRYLIVIYKQDARGYYKEIGHYKTKDKYLSLDNVESVYVIIPELEKIKHLILSTEKKQKSNRVNGGIHG